MSTSDMLTADDLRDRLYHSFKEKGLVDSLKSQLRQRLVSELRRLAESGDRRADPLTRGQRGQHPLSQDGSLFRQAADSLVAGHLRSGGYDYTLSVFMPECGLNDSKMFTSQDLLQLLQISPQSSLYRRIISAQADKDDHGLLWRLLTEVAAQHGRHSQTVEVQTSAVQVTKPYALEDKMREVDNYYSKLGNSCPRSEAAEEKIMAYQRQLDERSRMETKQEIARFKEMELSRMMMEEKENYQSELARTRKELERTYQGKVEGLAQRERHAVERMRTQTESQQKETFTQRQSVLAEIDVLRQKEAEVRRQEDTNKREHFLWGEQMRSREELVKGREGAVRRSEVEYEQKLYNEISKFKLEEQARYLERTKGLEVRECRVQDDERRLCDELQRVDKVKDELREKRSQVNELEVELTKTRHDMIAFEKQNEILSDKCRQMIDYQMLREENAVMKRELDTVRMRLAETSRDVTVERQKYEDLLRDLGGRGSRPSPELYVLEKELGKARAELKQATAIFQHQKQQLETRLAAEVERHRDLLTRFEEQTQQQAEMNTELGDLRQQLRQTRLALNNEVHRKPKHGVNSVQFVTPMEEHPSVIKSGSFCDYLETEGHDLRDPTSLRMATEAELVFSPTRGSTYSTGRRDADETTASQSDDLSYSFDIVRETKRRLKNLEKEAENLEQNYRNFHMQLTTVPPTVVPVSAAREVLAARVSLRDPILPPSLLSGVVGRVSSHMAPSVGLRGSDPIERPMSSTPARDSHIAARCGVGEAPLAWLNRSVSPVLITPPRPDRETMAVSRHRPLAVSDLEARPGSPSVVVLPGSTDSQASSRDGPPSLPVTSNPVKDIGAVVGGERVATRDDRSTRQDIDPRIDQTSRSHKAAQREREEEEEEEEAARDEEQRRRERAEERARREEDAWQAEQRALHLLQHPSSSQPETSVPEVRLEVVAGEAGEAGEAAGQGGGDDLLIDPVMKKYMAMVAGQRRDAEKENITKEKKKDKTPPISEPDLSLADVDKSLTAGGNLSADDFEW